MALSVHPGVEFEVQHEPFMPPPPVLELEPEEVAARAELIALAMAPMGLPELLLAETPVVEATAFVTLEACWLDETVLVAGAPPTPAFTLELLDEEATLVLLLVVASPVAALAPPTPTAPLSSSRLTPSPPVAHAAISPMAVTSNRSPA